MRPNCTYTRKFMDYLRFNQLKFPTLRPSPYKIEAFTTYLTRTIYYSLHSTQQQLPFFILHFTFYILHYTFFALDCPAQTPLNTWQTHSSFRNINGLEIAENRVYGFSNYGLFYANISDDKTTTLSKKEGLTEVGIRALGYSSANKKLVIGYESGNIDLIEPNGEGIKITNLPLIKNTDQISGSKKINRVIIRDNDALLATDFGVVRLDLLRSEIKETYRNIGKNGEQVAVFGLAMSNDSVFAQTSDGLLAARYSPSTNLQFYANWRPIRLPEIDVVSQIIVVNSKLYATIGTKLWIYEKGAWLLEKNAETTILSLANLNGQVVMGLTGKLLFLNGSVNTNVLLTKPLAIAQSPDKALWVATAGNGLIRLDNGKTSSFLPNSPQFNVYTKLTAFPNQVVALNSKQTGFDIFTTQQWSGYTSPQNTVAVTKNLDGSLVIGSATVGLFLLNNDLQKVAGSFQNISDLTTDKLGNVWVSTSSSNFSSTNLYVRRIDGSSQAFSLPRQQLSGILIDDNDYKWLRISDSEGGGLLIFDDKNNRSKLLSTTQNSGGLPNSGINDFAKDRDGAVWVATGAGVAVFDDPSALFSGVAINAYTPIFERRRLLANEFISCIAVDGGNNKWIGTRNGLFRFGPDGTTLLDKFTEANSPLPSNQILDVAVEPTGGDVFIATTKGIVSYRAASSEPESHLTKIKIFPNPVRPDFNGVVGISGLTENATVKITDLAGRLIFETRSEGGTASWNLMDYQGHKPETGIYLVLVSDKINQEALVGKLAIVR